MKADPSQWAMCIGMTPYFGDDCASGRMLGNDGNAQDDAAYK